MARTGRSRTARYAGRSVIVTGGASGIGSELARQLAGAGAHVVVADIEGADAAVAAMEPGLAGAGSVTARHLDVADAASFRAVVDDVVAQHGALDLLVNNAGISFGGPTHEMSPAHWDRMIEVDLGGVVNGVVAAYPLMVARGAGQIVNVASAAGLVAPPFVAAYAAAKHAVVGLSLALRPEAALHGVRVNVVCPGAVDTAILDRPPPADLPQRDGPIVTAREYLAVVGQRPIAPERCARLALRAMADDVGLAVVPRSARALWYLHRLSPTLALRATGVVARRVDDRLVRPAPRQPPR